MMILGVLRVLVVPLPPGPRTEPPPSHPTRRARASSSLRDALERTRVSEREASLWLTRAANRPGTHASQRDSERDGSPCETRAPLCLRDARASQRGASLCEARALLCLRDARASERDAPVPCDRGRLGERDRPPRLNGSTPSLGGAPFVSREGAVSLRETAEVRTGEALRQRVARDGGRDGSLSLVGGAVSRKVSSYVVESS